MANVVDTNYTILAKMPKRFLRPGTVVLNDTHRKLRKLSRALGAKARVS